MYIRTDAFNELRDNFNKFILSAKSFSSGNDKEGKWSILNLFMFMQSLFISMFSHNNSFEIIKMEYSKKKDNHKYIFKYDLTSTELFTLKDNKLEFQLAPFFGTDESFQDLFTALQKKGINFTIQELKDAFKQMNKLLPIHSLFKKVKKHFTNINNEMENSIYSLIELRNDFIHFAPKNWFIEKDLIKEVIINCSKLSLSIINSSYVRDYDIDKEEFKQQLIETLTTFGQSV